MVQFSPADRESGDLHTEWVGRLMQAFADRQGDYLALAEQAVMACPGDALVLHLAATAALLGKRAERAQVFLKRVAKRYIPDERDHLLQALALAQLGKVTMAAALLEKHGLNDDWTAARAFAPTHALGPQWLKDRLNAIRRGAKEKSPAAKGPAPRNGAPKPADRKSAAQQATKAAKGGKAPTTQPARGAKASVVPVMGHGTWQARPAASVVVAPRLAKIAADLPVGFEILDPASLLDTPVAGEGEADWFRLRADFARLTLLQEFDDLLCLPTLRGVDTYWHQVETVRKVLKQFRGRVLLADEVGLGKTIEAGMVVKEYLLRGLAERLLILVPPSLVGQWREEMEAKFDIPCASTHDPLFKSDPDAFWAQPRVIASLAAARRKEHADRLSAHAYDIVVVDEAHHLKNRSTRNHALVDGLKKRFLLLLSATPVQNSLVELYNLLTLLQPGIFRTEKDFRAAYMVAGHPRRPANQDRLRDLMRGVMIRNTRAVVALKLPRRQAATLRLDPAPEEAACYAALATLAREQVGEAGRSRLAVEHLLSAAGSSPAAAIAALNRFLERHPRPGWQAVADRYAAIALGAKEKALLDLLARNPAEKKMVFVHHRESLAHLDALLRARSIPFARFEGALSGPAKDEAIVRFRDQVPVLLCTESGGEGRNVQFCNTLINFDIPWNPMAIEQRIGRIDRIGQNREVFIFNLAVRGTLEDRVLALLDEKINMFELVVGEIGAILGELDDERDFAAMVLEAWLQTSDTDRQAAFTAIEERVTEASRDYEAVKRFDDELFGEDFETA